MIMRVITLLRGVLVSMRVHDVSSAIQWRPLAMQVLSKLTHVPRSPPASFLEASHQNGVAPASPRSTPPCMSPKKPFPFFPASNGGGRKGQSHHGSRQQGLNTPEMLLEGRQFLSQQEVEVAHAQLSPCLEDLPAGSTHAVQPKQNTLSPRDTPTRSSPSTATANSTTARHPPTVSSAHAAASARAASPMQTELSPCNIPPTQSSLSIATTNSTSSVRHPLAAASAYATSPTHNRATGMASTHSEAAAPYHSVLSPPLQNGKAAHATAAAALAQAGWGSPVHSKAAGVAPYAAVPPAYIRDNLYLRMPMSGLPGPQCSVPGVEVLPVAVPHGQGTAEGHIDSMQVPCLEPASSPSGVLF
ncbi:hypothetical protein DUNSADRAFT_14243 [Dunaliella salina]|uniref:Encoded protein n=1 Tax=Dunaliella salina TaxID=3046 RepID=A0ABQ7G7R2_DUNSA|nr:hypothetical protein DUNSADRAFT_14243 [Dunaliella salina]|eukprot:KAF5830642.1 hypothetical protein DUNSADRAFT_14243 [Dunaliella salina]